MTFFGPSEDYFALPDVEGDEGGSAGSGEGPEFRTLARQWCSTNFGTGEKSDTGTIVAGLRRLAQADLSRFVGAEKVELIAHMSKQLGGPTPDVDGLRLAIGWKTGRSSSGRLAIDNLPTPLTKTAIESMQAKFGEEADAKEAAAGTRKVPTWMPSLREDIERECSMPFKVGEGRDHIGEFSVMLDHAARRVSIAHSWIKRAEAERQRFVEDARRKDRVPAAARDWLDRLCAERSEASGVIADYRIRPRAIKGWNEIVRRWSSAACKTAADRIAAAREVQADPEIEKFGDIQLFEALAADDAECVWRPNGAPTPDPLKDYVAATDALAKQRRFKVPAYRHPDPLAHPVFCDFGNSRWNISFARHQLEKARTGNKRIAKEDTAWVQDPRGLRMGLWNGKGVDEVDLRWSCKRLVTDLALNADSKADAIAVTRADRLGRAAGGAFDNVAIRNVFEENDWNGRLQAPRTQLDRVARLLEKGKRKQAESLLRRIQWLISFSPRLRPFGPFITYAAAHGIEPNRRGEYYPNAPGNKGREGLAKLVLVRLPGLRVLSVDLGHRYAAACAVWEALPNATFAAEIAGRDIIAGGTHAEHLYCHTRHTDRDAKSRTTIYRRIGPDKLADDSDHPAPWARLDRQFLIKLPGEDRPARAASPAEIAAVQQLETDLGRVRTDADPLPRAVDALMAGAVRTVRLALRRHGDAARIAYAFKPDGVRLTPGGGEEPHTPETRAAAILDALLRWYELATGTRWRNTWAAEQWEARVRPRVGTALPAPADEADRWERKRHRAALEQALRPLAESLGESEIADLHRLWSERWADEDREWPPRLRRLRDWLLPRGLRAQRNETAEQAAARKARRGAARHVGGLSLTRIATIRELYQVQKAYATRPEPDDPRKRIAAKNEDRYDKFGRSVLQVVERLREQRVKQLASRIVEAALGVGRMKPAGGRDRRRPRSRVDAPCHAVVIESLRNYRPDELQTRRENRALMNWSAGKVRKYLEEACRLHGLHLREVMPNYTSRQCSRTGLPGVRCVDVPVDPNTGEPQAYWWRKALSAAKKRIGNGNSDASRGDAESRFIVDLANRLARLKEEPRPLPRTVRVPRAGGDLFVAAPPLSCSTAAHAPCPACNGERALQADLNAAANIGLRPLMDPDFPGKWWYVPCSNDRQAGGAIPRADRVRGSACFGGDPATFGPLSSVTNAPAEAPPDGQTASEEKSGKNRRRGKGRSRSGADAKETTNYWADPSTRALRPVSKGGHWLPTPAYWQSVRRRVVAALRSLNGLPPPVDARATPLDADAAPW